WPSAASRADMPRMRTPTPPRTFWGPGRPSWELNRPKKGEREHQPQGEPRNPPDGDCELQKAHGTGWNPDPSGPGGCQHDVVLLEAVALLDVHAEVRRGSGHAGVPHVFLVRPLRLLEAYREADGL